MDAHLYIVVLTGYYKLRLKYYICNAKSSVSYNLRMIFPFPLNYFFVQLICSM